MRLIKKCIAILLYLALMAVFLRFDVTKLFDLKQIGLVVIGTVILYLPHIGDDVKHLDGELVGQNALTGSMIACFVLLFITLSKPTEEGAVFSEIALACRPLFYGFCIWVIFGEVHGGTQKEGETGEGERKDETGGGDNGKAERRGKELTLEDCRVRLRELGLTKRETEVSLLVVKGMTNAEIASELYISETTVKKHLSNVFAKLQIGSREEIREKCGERV